MRRPLELRCVYSPDPAALGRVIPLEAPLNIGRDEGQLRVNDSRISSLHVSLRPSADGRHVEWFDHDSRNGVFINGLRAEAGPIAPRSVLRVGDTLFVVSAGEPERDILAMARAYRPELSATFAETLLCHAWPDDERELRLALDRMLRG